MFGSRKDSDKKKGGFWSSLFGRSTQEVQEETVVETPEQANKPASVADTSQEVSTPPISVEQVIKKDETTEPVVETVEPVVEAAPAVEIEEAVVETVEPAVEAAPAVEIEEAVVEAAPAAMVASAVEAKSVEQEEKTVEKGFFARMRDGLTKTRGILVEGIADIFIGKKEIDDDLLDELETQLLVADVGVEATSAIISSLTEKVKYNELDDVDL